MYLSQGKYFVYCVSDEHEMLAIGQFDIAMWAFFSAAAFYAYNKDDSVVVMYESCQCFVGQLLEKQVSSPEYWQMSLDARIGIANSYLNHCVIDDFLGMFAEEKRGQA